MGGYESKSDRIGEKTDAALLFSSIKQLPGRAGAASLRLFADFFELLTMPGEANGEEPARICLAGRALLQAFRSLKGVERLDLHFTVQDGVHLLVASFSQKLGA